MDNKQLYTSLQWSGFLTTSKWFVGPLLDYGGILHDKQKIEVIILRKGNKDYALP